MSSRKTKPKTPKAPAKRKPSKAAKPATKRKPQGRAAKTRQPPMAAEVGGDTLNGRDKTNGRFLPGNRWWAGRASSGPAPMFADGESLRKACIEYFEWVEDNPLYEDNLVTFQGRASHEPVAKMRAMTIGDMCRFLDVAHNTWNVWRREREDLAGAIEWVESVIRAQKFQGAAAGLLNASIIARDLGLAEKSELSGQDGGPIEVKTASPDRRDLARAIIDILRSGQTSG